MHGEAALVLILADDGPLNCVGCPRLLVALFNETALNSICDSNNCCCNEFICLCSNSKLAHLFLNTWNRRIGRITKRSHGRGHAGYRLIGHFKII